MMVMQQRVLLVLASLFIFGAKWGDCATIEFYKEENYNGFLEGFHLTGQQELDCLRLKDKDPIVKSIKTDKCIIVHAGASCGESALGSLQQSLRIDGNTQKMSGYVFSFHVCSQKRGGGPQLDIDLRTVNSAGIPGEKYRGVCNCRNVPSRLVGGDSRPLIIDNHGNSVNLYDRENCQGRFEYLRAGKSSASIYGQYGMNVRSFKPAELKHCYQLSAKIHKFDFKNGTDSPGDLPTEDVKLAADSDIINNGASEITQTYKVSSKVTETVEFKVAKSFTTMHSAGVETGVEMTFEAGIPLIASAEITTQITTKYEWSSTSGGETSNTTTVSTEESVEIEQQVRIPPCKKCTVSSFVKMVKGFPIKYKAYAKVSAPEGLTPLPANELRENLPAGMDYVRDIDQHTVEGVTDGTMNANYGMKSMIAVNCDPKPLPNCVPSAYSPADDHQIYVFPLHGGKQRWTLTSSDRVDFLTFLKNSVELLVKHLK